MHVLKIDVRDASDVNKAFAFSLATGVRLSIKNSGHDYKGRSSGRNTLSLWVGSISFLALFKMVLISSFVSDAQPSICNTYFSWHASIRINKTLQIKHSAAFVPKGCEPSTSYNAVTIGVCILIIIYIFIPSDP